MSCLNEQTFDECRDNEKTCFECMEGSVTVPSKPKKPCAYPGCPALVTGRYCAEHAKIVIMRNTEEIKMRREDMVVHGKGFVISMLQSIRSVKSATSEEFWFQWRRFTTSFL